MGYRDRTYVIFDGDEDMWAYGFMKGWNKNENMDFSFEDAHDVNDIRNGTQEETVKKKLRERLANTRQACVLVGESTRNLYRYVRWEIETCQEKDIPIVVVNLNNKRQLDKDLCPPILIDTCALHVEFKAKIIKTALDSWCPNYLNQKGQKTNLYYPDDVYKSLGL